MYKIYILLFALSFSLGYAQSVSKEKPIRILNPNEESLLTPYDQVVALYIPVHSEFSVIEKFRYLIAHPDSMQVNNIPRFGNLPRSIIEAGMKGECELISLYNKFPNHYDCGILDKDSIQKYFYTQLLKTHDKNEALINSYLMDTVLMDFSYVFELRMRVRDSMGVMIFTPIRLVLVWRDHHEYRPSSNLLIADLNQNFFTQKNESGESIFEQLSKMNYEYYPIDYYYRKGSKTYSHGIVGFNDSLALKYALLGGGTELFKNIKNDKYDPYSRSRYGIKKSKKDLLKSEKAWAKIANN